MFCQAEDGIRDHCVTGVQTCALPIFINEVFIQDLEQPPKNKLRKIVFKDGCGLDVKQKLSIVGQIIGRGKAITQEDIYEAMLQVYDDGKITISKIAKVLGCTPRTIHRNMGEELKQEKQLLNKNYEKNIN